MYRNWERGVTTWLYIDEAPCRGISLVEEPEIAIRKFLDRARSFKLSPDDYEAINTIGERWCGDELIASLCEELVHG